MKNKTVPGFLKITILSLFFVSLFSLFTSAELAGTSCEYNVTLVNQDPYPATPDSYVDVVFQMSGVGNANCKGAKFILIPSYPFSLDADDGVRTLDLSTWSRDNNQAWMIPFKLRVDKNALEGDHEIEVRYYDGSSQNQYRYQKISIRVEDAVTSFDAIIQEVSGSDVSIAIANTGKYAANSVIIRIPDQENFKTIGTDGQMVGNLDAGDYTIVSFSLNPLTQRITDGNLKQNKEQTLKFDVYYTDNIGERRIVNMVLPLNMGSNSSMQFAGTGNTRTTTTISWFSWYYVIALVVIITLFIIYKFIKNKKSSKKGNETPDWIKNERKKK